MDYEMMSRMAKKVYDELKPFCDRIEIGGSIRRKRPWVKDIEIICIPRTDNEGNRDQGFIDLVDSWEIRSGKATGKSIFRVIYGGIKLDIFAVVPDNWGYMFALRTGSKEYNRLILEGIRASGHKADKGFVWREGKVVPMREEKDLFALFNYPVPPPEKREM